MKLNGLAKLNKEFSKVVRPFGIEGMVNGEDFAWYREKNIITYTLLTGTFHDEWFVEFIKERFDYDVENVFVITLLHEIGHYKTDDEIGVALGSWCDADKERISDAIQNNFNITEEEEKALNWQYFYLPDEFSATAWAVKFAKENPEYIEEMWEKIEKALHKFYEKNEVTDD